MRSLLFALVALFFFSGVTLAGQSAEESAPGKRLVKRIRIERVVEVEESDEVASVRRPQLLRRLLNRSSRVVESSVESVRSGARRSVSRVRSRCVNGKCD